MTKPIRSSVRSSFARFENMVIQKKAKNTKTTWYGPNKPSWMNDGK